MKIIFCLIFITLFIVGCGQDKTNKPQNNYTLNELKTVVGVKQFLSDNSFFNGRINDAWSADVENAVKKFQKSAGINTDGIVGPYTRSKMLAWNTRSNKKEVDPEQLVLDYFESNLLGKSKAKATCKKIDFENLKSGGKEVFSDEKCNLLLDKPDGLGYGYYKKGEHSPISISGSIILPKGTLFIVAAEEWIHRDMVTTNFFYFLDDNRKGEIVGWAKFWNNSGLIKNTDKFFKSVEPMFHDSDPSCCNSYEVVSKYEVSGNSILLISRETIITSYGHKNIPMYDKWEKEKLNRKKEAKTSHQVRYRDTEILSRKISSVLSNPYYSKKDKAKKIKVIQRNSKEEMFTSAIRMVPIYDKRKYKFITFDSYMRHEVNRSNNNRSSALERDPVGAGMSIFFDSSASNIKKQLGLP